MMHPVDSRGGAAGLRLVGASAGSGKTYRLTQEVTHAVDSSSSAPIDVSSLVAVTYTKKAQAELETRIRRVLLAAGAFDRAEHLPLSYLGTVHAVGLRIVKEFALDAGLSPEADVISGNEGRRLLQAAIERELDPKLWERLETLATDLQLNWDARISRSDWVTPVEDIMTLARGNRIAAERLPEMGRRSADGLLALLPRPVPDGAALEETLGYEIRVAADALERSGDETKKTAEVISALRASGRALEHGGLPWSGWAKLTRLEPAKRLLNVMDPVARAAAAYEMHPRLHAQLRQFTELVFEAASASLEAYSNWKSQRGLVDYVDMIDRALQLLEIEAIARELSQRIELLVVDEFQDTSPIQLALFMKLHQLSGRSVWVGDPKQCIFEYAGADPGLMDAVTHWVSVSGGERENLPRNYRSRPELVDFNTMLFSAAFAAHGVSPEQVATTPERPPLLELTILPAVGLWWLDDKEHLAIAEGAARLLADPASTPVVDRITSIVRPVRAGDIAVLVYSNAQAENVADALKRRGINSVLPRVGLLKTPEGTFVTAALRYLVDERDTLASAEIDALTEFSAQSPDEWLTDKVQTWTRYREQKRREAALDGDLPPDPDDSSGAPLRSPWLTRLKKLRAQLPILSPVEALDRVLTTLDVAALASRWPDPEQRLANLEALRALAAKYEERCSYQRESASISGLLRYFEETQQQIRLKDEERATDEQHVGSGGNAVVISTFHKAKGLEWPVVIVASLGRERMRHAFEVTPESDREAFDAADPLGGRWIRYWPWPLDQQWNAPLAHRAERSTVGLATTARDARERVRLLYVAFTRARDHLVLAVHLLKKGPDKAWLDELCDDRGSLLSLPNPDDPNAVLRVRGLREPMSLPVRAWRLQPSEPDEANPTKTERRYWYARSAPNAEVLDALPPYRITPSRAASDALDLPTFRVVATTRFTKRMSFSLGHDTRWNEVGNALHAFLAADYHELTASERQELAARVLARAGFASAFTPEALLAGADALRSYLAARWPDAQWHREVPIAALLPTAHGARRIEGTIDLLLETPTGYVIVDHKSFPGREDQWATQALEYAPQLATYAKAVSMAGGTVLAMLIHFTVGGGVVEVGGE